MSWKAACPAGDVKQDKIKECTIDGVEIILVNVGDGFRAYPPVCPHMEQYLEGSGICANNVMTCDRHLWQWDIKQVSLWDLLRSLCLYMTRKRKTDRSWFS